MKTVLVLALVFTYTLASRVPVRQVHPHPKPPVDQEPRRRSFLELNSRQSGCAVPIWQGDNYCDDENNTPECEFDGGDCCDNTTQNWDYFCSVCECKEGGEGCAVPSWEGDSYCDDENNNAGCNWDGGDCCNNDSGFWDYYCQTCECLDPSAGGDGSTGSTDAPQPTVAPGDCQCGVVNAADRIVGGQAVNPAGKYPYQAALLTTNSDFFFCGGTIVSDRHILTAAHCTAGQSAAGIKVRLGEHSKTSNDDDAVDYLVAEIIQDPTYNQGVQLNNDFSILKLSAPISFRGDILPACLPASSDNDYVDYKAIVSGWGALSSGGPSPNVLHEVEVPILANENCGEYDKEEITENMMCAGIVAEGGIDACQGDSGGPLVTFDDGFGVIIGVVSWGYGCAAPNFPGIYARVTARLNWINDNIADGVICPAPSR